MLEVMMVLTVLNTAVAVAALMMAVGKGRPNQGGGHHMNSVADAAETEEKPFKLSDKKMQEGIANLLGYQPGAGGEDE